MARRGLRQAGFGAVALIFIVVFLLAAGFAGYKVISMNDTLEVDRSATTTLDAPSTIETEKDLADTGKSLDESGSQLESTLDDTRLDADIQTML